MFRTCADDMHRPVGVPDEHHAHLTMREDNTYADQGNDILVVAHELIERSGMDRSRSARATQHLLALLWPRRHLCKARMRTVYCSTIVW